MGWFCSIYIKRNPAGRHPSCGEYLPPPLGEVRNRPDFCMEKPFLEEGREDVTTKGAKEHKEKKYSFAQAGCVTIKEQNY